MTVAARIPPGTKQVVRRALQSVGYGDDLIMEGPSPLLVDAASESADEALTIPFVAFWGSPLDQYTSAIAVGWLADHQPIQPHLEQITADLWAPFTLVMSPDTCALWETLPVQTADDAAPFRLMAKIAASDDLSRLLLAHREQLGPQAVAHRKRSWRQMALYEASPEPNAFLQWAFEPTRHLVTQKFRALLREVLALVNGDHDQEAKALRWVLRMIGVRLIWDKRWVATKGSRAASEDILRAARAYPTPLRPAELPADLGSAIADLVVSHLGMLNLWAVDRGILSQVIQGHGLPQSLQQHWRLYPTPPDIAWRMLESLPIELIPGTDRLVWDGTCGTGTFLVAALDRLRALVPYTGAELRSYLVSAVAGNEIEPALADATRIALDQALGAAAGNEWSISVGDVLAAQSIPSNRPITVIAGNPPFKGGGVTGEMAAEVIQRYVEGLPAGGMLSVVGPRTILASNAGAEVRKQLLSGFDIMEVWELPEKVFPKARMETAVLLARKRLTEGDQPNAVIWRVFNRDRSEQWIDATQQQTWANEPGAAMWPPLAMRLRDVFAEYPNLANFVQPKDRCEGIVLGTAALNTPDVLDHHEPGTEPFLVGRTNMLPFYLPSELDRHWIRYGSARIERNRRLHEQLFREAKVIVSRQATRGATWRMRAAVDRKGLVLSDRLIAVKPSPPLGLHLLAGILNSLLANVWFRLVNPAFNLRLDSLLSMPVPKTLNTDAGREVEELAGQLEQVWTRIGSKMGADDEGDGLAGLARELTLRLDDAVFRLYEVPLQLQAEVAAFFRWLGGPRPGFPENVIGGPDRDAVSDLDGFGPSDADRMAKLFEEKLERALTEPEERELDTLVRRWEQAEFSKLRGRPLPAGMASMPQENQMLVR